MTPREDRCANFNHGRLNTTVRFCSLCGKVVNQNISAECCSEEKHAKTRSERSKY